MPELVVKDNVLINASYSLDLVEQRLILLAILEARESGKGINANDPLTVRAETYINQFGVHKNTAYQALKDACKSLFSRQFSYQTTSDSGNLTIMTSRWVSEIGYTPNEGSVRLIFAPAIVPLIIKLEEHFTKYDIEQISGLSSAYAVRLYELLMCWRAVGHTPTLLLEDLRGRLGVLEDEHSRLDNFKRKVLDIGVKQISQNSDIIVTYEQHKKGRTITGFSFKFKFKKPKPKPKVEPAQEPQERPKIEVVPQPWKLG